MASYRSRVLGGIGPLGRISRPVFGLSSSTRPLSGIVPDVSVGVSSVSCPPSGDREDLDQERVGDCSKSGSQLLQSPFSGGKGDRRLASRDRSLSPEWVCSSNSVQDGISRLGTAFRPRGRFPSFRGFEGHVFSNTRSSVLAKTFAFRVGRDSLPVQGPVIQGVDCTPGLYPSVCSRVSVGALSRDSTSPVPGRLAGPCLLGGSGQTTRLGTAVALSLSGDCDKR